MAIHGMTEDKAKDFYKTLCEMYAKHKGLKIENIEVERITAGNTKGASGNARNNH